MLHVNHISSIEVYTPEWYKMRLGRLTSSRMNVICGEKEFSEASLVYLYQKVGEILTGQSSAMEDECIEDENTAWGNQYEPDAIRKFGVTMGLQYLAVQKLILNPDRNFSSTPDGIWIKGICKNQEEYNVRTVEVKCPRKFHKFVQYYMCKTTEQIKKLNKVYYWQVLDQMDNCGSAVGYLVFYHPMFPVHSNMSIIEFDKMKLWDEFKFLQIRKKNAVQKLRELVLIFSETKQVAACAS